MGACFENRDTIKNRKICQIEPSNINKKEIEPSLSESFELKTPINNNKKVIETSLPGDFEQKTPNINKKVIEPSLPESFELKTPNINEEAARPIIESSLPKNLNKGYQIMMRKQLNQ